MKAKKLVLLLTEIFLILASTTGCWNYREVDNLAIVAGVAIDKGKNNNYLITVEIVNIESGGKEAKTTSKKLEMEGETIFDGARNTIKISGKRLYFSHIKIVIISKEIAKEGLVPVLDWFNRDAELRHSIHILVSKEKTATELLSQQSITNEIRSFEIEDMIMAQNSVAKAPNIIISKLIDSLSGEGISATLPAVGITMNQGEKTSELSGTAVFKKDKFVGLLDEKETKDFLFITDNVKKGLIIEKELEENKKANITFEIFKSKTKVKPVYKNGEFTMDILIRPQVAIAEQGTTKDYIDKKGMKQIKTNAEKKMETDIEKLVKKVQEKYGADIFGFGRMIFHDKKKLWKGVKENWDEEFKNVNVKVKVELDIKNSALSRKPIKVGD